MRIAVLSDIHANLAALEAVRADLPTVDEVWVLGDTVGYGPQPNEVIATLQEMGARASLGNHDGAAIGTVDAAYFNPDARAAIEWTADGDRRQRAGLPRRAARGAPRRRPDRGPRLAARPDLGVHHRRRRSPPRTSSAFETRLCLFGHTHLPIVYRAVDGEVEATSGHARRARCELDGGAGAGQPRQRRTAARRPARCGVRHPGDRRRDGAATSSSSAACATTSTAPSA